MKILWKTFYFDSAHFLPDYKGRCHEVHGHRWRVEVGIKGEIQQEGSDKGMIIDFSKLKEKLGYLFNDVLDHTLINDLVPNPTAENIIGWIVVKIDKELSNTPFSLVGLKLYETPDSCIEWRGNNVIN